MAGYMRILNTIAMHKWYAYTYAKQTIDELKSCTFKKVVSCFDNNTLYIDINLQITLTILLLKTHTKTHTKLKGTHGLS